MSDKNCIHWGACVYVYDHFAPHYDDVAIAKAISCGGGCPYHETSERTCHLSEKHPAHSFDGQARDCLGCGYEFDCDCGEDERFPYCPGCGAKVVDDER